MSLAKSLTSPSALSLLSDLNGNNYSNALPAGVTLDHYFPLKSDLLCSVNPSVSAIFSRASTSSVTDWRGNTLNYGIDEPAFTGVSLALGFGAAPDNLQLPTDTVGKEWAVNDCWMYQKTVFLGSDNNFPRMFESSTTGISTAWYPLIADNKFRLFTNVAAGSGITLEVDHVNPLVSGDVLEALIIKDSSVGTTVVFAVNGTEYTNSDATTRDLEFQSTAYIGNRPSLGRGMNGYFSNCKFGKLTSETSITLDQARRAV